MELEPEVTLNQPVAADAPVPAYMGEIYQIYKLDTGAKLLPVDKIFAAIEVALASVPQPAEELAKIDAARRIPNVLQRLQDLQTKAADDQ